MLSIPLFVIAISLSVLMIGLILQRELFAKILFLSSLTNLVIMLITMLGTYKHNESYIDIAIIYAALSFIVNQAILKFIILNKKA